MAAPTTIPQVLENAVRTWGDRVAIEDGRSLSFADLQAEVDRASAGLRGLGIEKGDRVAIWAPNMWEWVVAALGIHSAGAVLVPINTRYKGREARFILDDSGAEAVFTVDGFLGLDFLGMLGDHPVERVVFRTDSWTTFMAGGIDGHVEVDPEDLSDILFTSGTTGRPKGVMTTHAQTCRAFSDWSEVVGLTEDDRYLVVAPFFHCFGYKAGWLACLMRGATILPQPTFDVDAVLERIPRDRVSVLPGPPALYETFLKKERPPLPSLRLAVTGAAVIPVTLVEQMRDELGFDTVITGYGLTEASGVVTMCRFDDDPATIAKTSGRAIPGVEVRVVDLDGTVLPPGEAGEVQVRGYNVMGGYWQNPEATAAAVVDGWLKTGDVGVLDERGYLRITDRIKDMFIVGGFNAYPAEIEHELMQYPGMREVAVIGVPDERLGEVGCAYVVGDAIVGDALIGWARERMANFKVPRRVIGIGKLPRNASNKVEKYKLREMFCGP